MRELVTKLKQKYTLTDVVHQRDALTYLTCEKKWAVELVTELKLQEGFTHLTLLTAVDWLEEGNFQLTYLLNNPDTMQTMGVRVLLPRDEASMHSIHHLWATAATYQRELYEMFGIDFPGSPRLDEPFILEGWKDLPPYRLDFDSKAYSERTYFPRKGRYTHAPEQYMKEQLSPKGGKNV